VTDARHREEIARIWGVPARRIQAKPGLDAVGMFEALEAGELKALWVVGCNPMATMPNANQIRRALQRAEMLVVQDCYHPTETTQLAHVLLPAAMSLETEGTMTNSERRVSLLQALVPPPGDARPDWEIGSRFAALLGFEEQFSYASASDVFEEHKRCCANVYALQMNGISYRRLRRHAVQWPCPDYSSHGVARRYRNKIFATRNGRAQFHAVAYQPPADSVTPRYPLVLNTGRLAGQWHSRTKTGHVAKLNKMDPEPFVAAHPSDATDLGLKEGDTVRIVSRRGFARSTLRLDDGVRAGTLFMPFHWGQLYDEHGCANALTHGEYDPVSRQPELKFSAVRLEKADS
jgi:predicted molibdopterin-dependent oxidoreductase YjgC